MSNSGKTGGGAIRYIAGDVGGTNTRLLLIERSSGPQQASANPTSAKKHHDKEIFPRSMIDETGVLEVIIAQSIYPSKKYTHLTGIIGAFLNENPGPLPEACVLAVAGPVHNNQSHVTNLNWFLDGEQMSQLLHIPHVILLNDFVAVGYGLLALTPSDVVPLNTSVVPVPKAPIACVGAGTGLGETYLTYNGKEYDVWPAEGGHTSFAPRNEIEFRLMSFFKDTERLPSVSVERVVSGTAIPKIYQFFARRQPSLVNHDVDKEINSPKNDPGQVIATHALNNTDTLCAEVLDMFVKLYGAEAGDFSLKILPFGGLYVAGGIAAKILPLMLEQNKFLENFLSKGRMRPVLERVPVYVVIHPQPGLLGSRVIARRFCRDAIAPQKSLEDKSANPQQRSRL